MDNEDKVKTKTNSRFSLKPNLFDLGIFIALLIMIISVYTVTDMRAKIARNEGGIKTAHVVYNGNEIMNVELNSIEEDYEVILKEEDYPMIKERIVISFSKYKGVSITEAHCLNKVCVNEGYIKDTSRTIVCMPSGVIIYITSSESNNERRA